MNHTIRLIYLKEEAKLKENNKGIRQGKLLEATQLILLVHKVLQEKHSIHLVNLIVNK